VSPRRPDSSALAIAERAARCSDLGELALTASTCTACAELVVTRTTVVTGDFTTSPRFLVVGEAPGAQEDEVGRPFVGKAGRLLDELLAGAGVERSAVAVANVLKCRPPGNRAPTRAEAGRCTQWLDRQVELLDPALVVALGGAALAWALGYGVRLGDVRGQLLPWRGRRLLVSYHPSAASRFGPNGTPRAALETDLRLAAEVSCPS
jgi:uracil-DNA glycosylase